MNVLHIHYSAVHLLLFFLVFFIPFLSFYFIPLYIFVCLSASFLFYLYYCTDLKAVDRGVYRSLIDTMMTMIDCSFCEWTKKQSVSRVEWLHTMLEARAINQPYNYTTTYTAIQLDMNEECIYYYDNNATTSTSPSQPS